MPCRFKRLTKKQADYLLYFHKRSRENSGMIIKSAGFYGTGKPLLTKSGWRYSQYFYDVIVDWYETANKSHVSNLLAKFIRHIEDDEKLPKQKRHPRPRCSREYLPEQIENLF
jgi:hypothetical protein